MYFISLNFLLLLNAVVRDLQGSGWRTIKVLRIIKVYLISLNFLMLLNSMVRYLQGNDW